MAMKIAIYGKGGIGKSTISSNLSVCFSKLGYKTLQVGCDPKHDSTFPITHQLIPTVIEILDKNQFNYEKITLNNIIFEGFENTFAVESGGPSAGKGCGGYVIGETIKLLNEFGCFDNFEVIIFDVLGDIVCGGFSVPLQYSDYVCIICSNDFDSLFAANRICAGIESKHESYPVRLAGLIANRCKNDELIKKYANLINTKLISYIGDSEIIRNSRIIGKTLFEMGEKDLLNPFYKIATYLKNLEKVETYTSLNDREMFEMFKS